MQIAHCFRDGKVHLGPVPEGAVELFRGPDADVRRLVEATTDSDNRIPELAETTSIAKDRAALLSYLKQAEQQATRLVTVSTMDIPTLEAENEVTGR